MKIYVYTLTERNWWKDNWETIVTGVADEPISYFNCDEVQVWERWIISL